MKRAILTGAILLGASVVLVLSLRDVQLPETVPGTTISPNSLVAFLQQVSGQAITTDFQVDWASAAALVHGRDPYAISAEIFEREGAPSWGVGGGNPHPPMMVSLILPLGLLTYQNALTVYAMLMVWALIAAIHLVGVRMSWAFCIGLALAITFPGAYGIGNAVPLIGLGVAFAYRFRDSPFVAALGLTLAAAPKFSGLLLLVPFVLSGRWRAVAWAGGMLTVLAVLPVAFFRETWPRYLDEGVKSIAANSGGEYNGSPLHLASKVGLGPAWAIVLLVLIAAGVALVKRETFWPVVWLSVAALPITWMYSLLTLIPLFVAGARTLHPLAVASSLLAVGLAASSPPLGFWPTIIVPTTLSVSLVALCVTPREPDFWVTVPSLRGRSRRVTTADAGSADRSRVQA